MFLPSTQISPQYGFFWGGLVLVFWLLSKPLFCLILTPTHGCNCNAFCVLWFGSDWDTSWARFGAHPEGVAPIHATQWKHFHIHLHLVGGHGLHSFIPRTNPNICPPLVIRTLFGPAPQLRAHTPPH